MKNKIAKYRHKLGWTQEQLGKQCGFSREKIAHLECENREPKLRDAFRIARALGKKVEKVFKC